MRVCEFGIEHEKTIAMFQCSLEPGWVFYPSAKALSRDYHVFLFVADGHDELGTTFISVEKYTDDGAKYLHEKGISHLERWTPKGENPEEHYRRIFEFEKHHLSSKTIYNVFWSANNYSMPELLPKVDTEIEYWYGEDEKKARKNNLAYTVKAYPQTVPKEFSGLAHAELVLMYPERFREEVVRFLE